MDGNQQSSVLSLHPESEKEDVRKKNVECFVETDKGVEESSQLVREEKGEEFTKQTPQMTQVPTVSDAPEEVHAQQSSLQQSERMIQKLGREIEELKKELENLRMVLKMYEQGLQEENKQVFTIQDNHVSDGEQSLHSGRSRFVREKKGEMPAESNPHEEVNQDVSAIAPEQICEGGVYRGNEDKELRKKNGAQQPQRKDGEWERKCQELERKYRELERKYQDDLMLIEEQRAEIDSQVHKQEMYKQKQTEIEQKLSMQILSNLTEITRLENQLMRKVREQLSEREELQRKDTVIRSLCQEIKIKEQLNQRDQLIKEKEQSIRERDQLIQEKQRSIQERDQLIQERDQFIQEKEQLIQEKEQLIQERDQLTQETQQYIFSAIDWIRYLAQQLNNRQQILDNMTEMIRRLANELERLRRNPQDIPDGNSDDGSSTPPGVSRCKVCLSEDVNILFRPCRHVCCGAQCAPQFVNQACPVCREIVEDFEIVFIS